MIFIEHSKNIIKYVNARIKEFIETINNLNKQEIYDTY